jgi:hypothetical protein
MVISFYWIVLPFTQNFLRSRDDDPGVSPETITGWYTEVYEPVFAVGGGSE